jgi:FkbM family methyltransferase
MFENALSERETNIYNRLCDEESRLVFNARKHFTLTNDAMHLANVFVNRKQLAEVVQKLNGKTYILYGGGFGGGVLERYFDILGISNNCKGIWDNNQLLHGKTWYKLSITAPNYELLGKIDTFLITAINTQAVTSITQDLTSRGVTLNSIMAVESFDRAIGRCGIEEVVQYFDKEIIVPRLSKNEAFIDAGCCNFSTSQHLLELNSNVKRIYAFEPDHENMKIISHAVQYNNVQHIVKLYDFALWSSNQELEFWVSDFNKGASKIDNSRSNTKILGRKLDNIVSPEDIVSFIKMDIEGAELQALKGCAEIIKLNKPKLAISIYHKEMDYVDIAEYICSLVPEYKLYMRHYTPIYAETVLYCVK